LISSRHIDPDDLTLYALQLLGEQEAAAIAEHLQECAECRSAVAALQGDLTALALTSELQSPPASAKQRLFQQIAREKKVAHMVPPVTAPVASPVVVSPAAFPVASPTASAVVSPATSPATAEENKSAQLEEIHRAAAVDSHRANATDRDSAVDRDDVLDSGAAKRSAGGGRVMPWLGWAVAAGAVVAAGYFYHQGVELRSNLIAESSKLAQLSEQAERGQAVLDALTDQAAVHVTLSQTPETPKPVGRATYVADNGTLLFTASNLEPLPEYKTYELWLLPANEHDPIPAGTFQPDARGNASVILPQLPKGVIAKAFGVTIEDAGGSQQPTLPIILVGAPT
jgi:anti-sigma-K factor RskA